MSLSVSCSKYFSGITYLNLSFETVCGIVCSGLAREELGEVPGHFGFLGPGALFPRRALPQYQDGSIR